MGAELSTEVYVAVVILVSKSHHYITELAAEQISLAEDHDFIRLPNGVMFKKSAIMDILPTDEYQRQFPEKNKSDAHQPYSEPPVGFVGIINRESRLSALDAMKRGLLKAKANFGNQSTPNIDRLLKLADTRRELVK